MTNLRLFFFIFPMKTIQIISLFLLGTLLLNCSSSRLLSSTSDPSFKKTVIEPVLVVGVSEDETKRRIYEDTFTDSFIATDSNAIASYTLSKEGIEPDEAALREVIKKSGAKTILITHLVSADEKDFYQPDNLTIGTKSYSSGLYGYYPFIYQSVYSAGSYNSTTKVTLETSLYDIETEKLIWTARSQSIDPVMTRKYYQQLIDLFISDLKAKNLL